MTKTVDDRVTGGDSYCCNKETIGKHDSMKMSCVILLKYDLRL